jgi:zinc ribbon protein
LAAPEAPAGGGSVYCRECGKTIEADARFCRFCGKSQLEGPGRAAATGVGVGSSRPPASTGRRTLAAPSFDVEGRLRQVFPRHSGQDEFMHIGTIAACLMALIGFVLGFFPSYSWLGVNFLLGSIALLLFLKLRESTLSHIRDSRPGSLAASGPGTRRGDLPAEAATSESSPPKTAR